MEKDELALLDLMRQVTETSSPGGPMRLCCAPSEDAKKELAADDSAVVEEAVCKAEEVPEGTKKEVELKGRKIVIINDKGTLYALNGLCSHYNFPLVNGVYSKGKLHCALHGACFDVKTGDIEDYPAFDSIHPFQIKQVGDDLVIKTTEKRLSSDRRTRKSWIKATNGEKPLIVIGCGPSAQTLVENLRLAGCQAPITMLTKESIPPYDRVQLSKFVGKEPVRLREDKYYKENFIEVKTNTEATALDTDAHTVTLQDGTVLPYSRVVLALGGKVRNLPNKGGDLKGVFTLRKWENSRDIAEAAKDKDVVCVGSSFIGMEASSSLSKSAKSVTVISQSPEPLPVFGEGVGRTIRMFFESKGVKFFCGVNVDKLNGDKEGYVKNVVLTNGEEIDAEVVIVGIGVEPDTKWLGAHGIALDDRGFIKVNTKFETNVKDVFAIGDVVTVPLPFWGIESINIQHFQVAQRHGHLAAWSMEGKPQPGKLIPFFWSLFFGEKGVRLAGCTQGHDEIIKKGSVEAFDFVHYYLKHDKVVAVMFSGKSKAVFQFLALCDQDTRITKRDVEENETDDWKHLLL